MKRVAVLPRCRCGRWTPIEANHIAETHALALLLASVIKTLSLDVGGVLEDASLKRFRFRHGFEIIHGRRVRTIHHFAAVVVRMRS